MITDLVSLMQFTTPTSSEARSLFSPPKKPVIPSAARKLVWGNALQTQGVFFSEETCI